MSAPTLVPGPLTVGSTRPGWAALPGQEPLEAEDGLLGLALLARDFPLDAFLGGTSDGARPLYEAVAATIDLNAIPRPRLVAVSERALAQVSELSTYGT